MSEDATGWLLRITPTTCLDYLRRTALRERLTSLVDPLDLPELAPGDTVSDPERATILREDVAMRKLVLAALLGLAACGGGGDDGGSPDAMPTPPDAMPPEPTLTSFVIDQITNHTANDIAPVAYSDFANLPDPDQGNANAYSALFP